MNFKKNVNGNLLRKNKFYEFDLKRRRKFVLKARSILVQIVQVWKYFERNDMI